MAAQSGSAGAKIFQRFYYDFSLYDQVFHKYMSKGQYAAA